MEKANKRKMGVQKMEVRPLEKREDLYRDEGLYRIMAQAIFAPSQGKVKSIAEATYGQRQTFLYVGYEGEKPIGLIGGRMQNKRMEILHIAVAKEAQKLGFGKGLMDFCIQKMKPTALYAETDGEAVKFYEKLRFRIETLANQDYGILRYGCHKELGDFPR